jgi:hypothetical protein
MDILTRDKPRKYLIGAVIMQRTVLGLAILLLAGILAAAFWWLDFHAARSETQAEHVLETFTTGEPEKAPPASLKVYVADTDGFAEALRAALVSDLQQELAIGRVESADTIGEQTGTPVLVVEPDNRTITWTPVYGSNRLTAHIAYTSNGDLSWRDKSPVRMDSTDAPAIWVRGEFKINDTTWGLISHRWYLRHLAKELAAEVTRALESQLISP